MISYNLNSIDKAKNLVRICEKYKDDFNIDVIHGRQVIDGVSILGVISLVGNIVTVKVSNENSSKYQSFVDDVINANK